MNKHCPKCETVKPISEFGNNPRNRDGKQVYCKKCYLVENKKSKLRRKKEWYHEDGFLTEEDHFNYALRTYADIFQCPSLLKHLTNTGSIQRYNNQTNPL